MPQYRQFKVVVYSITTFASSAREGEEIIKQWQEAEGEIPDSGVKANKEQLGWEEYDGVDNPATVVGKRNTVLEAFLQLMHRKLPGADIVARALAQEKPRIITLTDDEAAAATEREEVRTPNRYRSRP